jgi:hypothetical protein
VPLSDQEIAIAKGAEPSGLIHVRKVVDPTEIDVACFEKSYWACRLVRAAARSRSSVRR